MLQSLRVLIVADYASVRLGGEPTLPIQYFRKLRQRGIEAWMLVHEGSLPELQELFPKDLDRIHTSPDLIWHRILWAMQQRLPDRLGTFTCGTLRRFLNQFLQRRLAQGLIDKHQITVVHQPIPVSPREPSLLSDLSAPLIIGPMNGAMTYPPGFRQVQWQLTNTFLHLGRLSTGLMNQIFPGKLQAEMLLVANDRTRQALPKQVQGQVITLVENGVDFQTWQSSNDLAPDTADRNPDRPIRFIYVGRLITWKSIDLLLRAFAKFQSEHSQNRQGQPRDACLTNASLTNASLTIVGDGNVRADLQSLTTKLGLQLHEGESLDAVRTGTVHFTGWLSPAACAQQIQQADVFVLPSLMECGGAVILEAMALGRPVIATNWGGPMDYVSSSSGILVDPIDPEAFVEGLYNAMVHLAQNPELRRQMGQSALTLVHEIFDWERKIDTILQLYCQVQRQPAQGVQSQSNLNLTAQESETPRAATI
jgi:glycosyltransferase involved in cell wall biosynthesis